MLKIFPIDELGQHISPLEYLTILRRAEFYVKKEILVNFLTDPQEGRSTLRPTDVLVYFQYCCVQFSEHHGTATQQSEIWFIFQAKMARLSSHHNGNSNTILFVFPFLVLLQTHFVSATSESNIVKFLPGFQGPLPFLLETGYIEVSETEADENAEVFYYFIESENNPKQDPLLLWLTGGPGCSAFSGLVFEIGPLTFINDEYNGSLPNLALRSLSWTKVSNIIFLDLPAGTGFSYPKTETAVQQSTWKLAHNAHQFLRKVN
ncbi:serine carboxypeptidase [Trifolium pratense]|uniref:Serine carboxypeptidase n=1 Tax=Trifolium pratense TaxID=57577 RepID=A0A2K3L0P6_TRIPR|nr:serine carboxypeptidase [Trifolium pratense]